MNAPPMGRPCSPDRFGTLLPKEMLLADARGARIFVFEDPSDQELMLAYLVGEGDRFHRYLIVPTSEMVVSDLQSLRMPLSTALAHPRGWVLDLGPQRVPSGVWVVSDPLTPQSLGIVSRSDVVLPGPSLTLPRVLTQGSLHGLRWAEPSCPSADSPTFARIAVPVQRNTPDVANPTLKRILKVTHEHAPLPLFNNRYRIIDRLGNGTFGSVFHAWDQLKNRPVAIKVLTYMGSSDAEQQRAEARFVREADLMRSAHENRRHHRTPPIYSLSTDGTGRPVYLVMELLEGSTLDHAMDALCAREPGWLERSCEIARQIAEGLVVIHQLRETGVVHRDIKPANVWLRLPFPLPANSIPPVIDVVVMDLGLALDLDGSRISVPGTRLGTKAYMSPEQYFPDPEQAPTPASDVYSLGVIFAELVLGRAFPTGHMTRHREGIPDTVPGVPAWILGLLRRMLARDPGRRPGITEVIDVIDDHIPHTPDAGSSVLSPLPSELLERYRMVARATAWQTFSGVYAGGADAPGLITRLEQLPGVAAIEGQFIVLQLACLIRDEFRTTFARLKEENKYAKERLEELSGQKVEDAVRPAKQFHERLTERVNEFTRSVERWEIAIEAWPELSEQLNDIQQKFLAMLKRVAPTSSTGSTPHAVLDGAIKRFEDQIRKLEETKKDIWDPVLDHIRTDAERTLTRTLLRIPLDPFS